MANNGNQNGRGVPSEYDGEFEDYSRYDARSYAANGREPTPSQAPAGAFVPASASYRPGRGHGAADVAGQYSRSSATYQGRSKGSGRGKKIGVAILIIALVAAVAGIAFYTFKEIRKSEVNAGLHDMEKEELEAVDAEVTGKTTFSEPFTVLLLGSDERLDDPDMGARTDTIILVRVDPIENHVSMVSVPRDTMIDLDGVGQTKINSAYTYGGAAGAIAAVKDLTQVEIDHYAQVNFENLVSLVDAIGGIDVYIDEEIDDPEAWGHLYPGQQHLNGDEALVLARSRAFVDGDYTRQVNQRKVILAIIDRVLNASSTEMTGLISVSTGFVSTDSGIDFDFLLSLAQQMRKNGNEGKPLNITSATIPSQPAYVGEVSYVIADTAGLAELMQVFVSGGDVSLPVESSSIESDVAAVGGTNTPPATSTYGEETYYGGGYGYYYDYY